MDAPRSVRITALIISALLKCMTSLGRKPMRAKCVVSSVSKSDGFLVQHEGDLLEAGERAGAGERTSGVGHHRDGEGPALDLLEVLRAEQVEGGHESDVEVAPGPRETARSRAVAMSTTSSTSGYRVR